MKNKIIIRQLGRQTYQPIWQTMKDFTYNRDEYSIDELWLLEHEPVFTQGQAGKPQHLLNPGPIPVVYSDRGGQVTYHGPGQLIVYCLIDIARKKMSVRDLVASLEKTVIELLARYGISAECLANAPGVYVDQAKICSLGLRVRQGRTYHGLSLNIDMDLEPFNRINPCGFVDLDMTQIRHFAPTESFDKVQAQLLNMLINKLDYSEVCYG